MTELDAGHLYILKTLDAQPDDDLLYLQYVKREGAGYPGNIGHHFGTTMQEVCRVQIRRAQYVNNQIPCSNTTEFIKLQRESILQLEMRAAERHGRKLKDVREDIENEPTCAQCGHIQCNGSHKDHSAHSS